MSPEPGPPGGTAARARASRRPSGEGGQAVVEFALVLPVLMLILVGILKGGLLFNNYLQLTDAVRTGGRELAIERGQPNPCGDAASAVTTALSLSQAQTALTITMSEYPEGPNDSPPSTGPGTGAIYTWHAGSGSTTGAVSSSTGDCGFTLTSGSAVTVTAQYPCDFGIFQFDVPDCTLTASATERVE